MSKMHTLSFDQAGNIKVDVTGYVGKACAETTEKLLAGIGAKTTDEKLKPEYNRSAPAAQTQQRW